MAPSISGHGGDFELINIGTQAEPDYRPNLEFTLPIAQPTAPEQIEFGIVKGDLRLDAGEPKPPNKNPNTKNLRPSHPNFRSFVEVSGLEPELPPDGIAKGQFEIRPPAEGDGAVETMPFVIRFHETSSPGIEKIIINNPNSGSSKSAVTFSYTPEAGFYHAVIIYNFREYSEKQGYKRLPVQIATQNQSEQTPQEVYLKRVCYVYVVAAKDADNFRDPQNSSHDKTEWTGAKLEIDILELLDLMNSNFDRNLANPFGYKDWVERFADWTLYHVEAQNINNTNMEENALVCGNPTPITPGTTKFTINPAEFPLGLYVITAPLDINTATPEELVTLERIGNVKAREIIRKRVKVLKRNFVSVDEVLIEGLIGNITLEAIRDKVTVEPKVSPQT